MAAMTAGGLKIFMVDDSATALDFARRQLEDAGHEVESSQTPENAIPQIREYGPDLIILDVMMPVLDGVELCRRIRADEALSETPIVMASAKAYDADKDKAAKAGANGYIVKPFSMPKFYAAVDSLFSLKVATWGVRGTLPMPQPGYIGYGGHTSCYSLQLSPERHLIFDAGTGIKRLGGALLEDGVKRLNADLFITHPHLDHINGFPFFAPLYIGGNALRVHGAAQDEIGFEQLMLRQMDGIYFPVTAREFGAHVTFHELAEQTLELDGVRVRTMLLKHPGHCLGYRVDCRGRSFCYITDNELYPEDSEFADEEFLNQLAEFCRGTNILVHDCTYFDEEYPRRVHWGHSPLSEVCRLAHLAGAERLWIHHHDPDQDDEQIERKLDFCEKHLAELGSDTVAVLPREGAVEEV
jgi:CheY-like chemotaxis protein/ribonuclease BN (tRNA processing enzyme)